MSKTIFTVPICSLRPWRGGKAHVSESTPQPPQSHESPDTQVLDQLKQISSTLKSLPYRREINQKVLQELQLPDATDFSTDIPINTLQDLWTQGQLKETPEQTAAVAKSLEELMENPNISQEEKEFWMKISRTNNRTE
jgi:hypothetical protein